MFLIRLFDDGEDIVERREILPLIDHFLELFVNEWMSRVQCWRTVDRVQGRRDEVRSLTRHDDRLAKNSFCRGRLTFQLSQCCVYLNSYVNIFDQVLVKWLHLKLVFSNWLRLDRDRHEPYHPRTFLSLPIFELIATVETTSLPASLFFVVVSPLAPRPLSLQLIQKQCSRIDPRDSRSLPARPRRRDHHLSYLSLEKVTSRWLSFDRWCLDWLRDLTWDRRIKTSARSSLSRLTWILWSNSSSVVRQMRLIGWNISRTGSSSRISERFGAIAMRNRRNISIRMMQYWSAVEVYSRSQFSHVQSWESGRPMPVTGRKRWRTVRWTRRRRVTFSNWILIWSKLEEII